MLDVGQPVVSQAATVNRRGASRPDKCTAACALPCHLQERREDLLRRLLAELHSVCDDIGEDVKAAAVEVHPNLVYMW